MKPRRVVEGDKILCRNGSSLAVEPTEPGDTHVQVWAWVSCPHTGGDMADCEECPSPDSEQHGVLLDLGAVIALMGALSERIPALAEGASLEQLRRANLQRVHPALPAARRSS